MPIPSSLPNISRKIGKISHIKSRKLKHIFGVFLSIREMDSVAVCVPYASGSFDSPVTGFSFTISSAVLIDDVFYFSNDLFSPKLNFHLLDFVKKSNLPTRIDKSHDENFSDKILGDSFPCIQALEYFCLLIFICDEVFDTFVISNMRHIHAQRWVVPGEQVSDLVQTTGYNSSMENKSNSKDQILGLQIQKQNPLVWTGNGDRVLRQK
uniref:Uncharacterized protein n=1 Tax=Solanum lycopersicum TaxID=4081 RepID=A0A3Q7F7L7_SOLLC